MEDTSHPSQLRGFQCPKCPKTFDKKDRLQKHVSKDHRKDRAPPQHQPVAYEQPKTIPSNILPDDLKVISLYYIKIPAGFHKKDLPLMKVRVRLHGEAQESIYVKYSDVKDRFPKQLCDFLEQHVVFRRRTDDSNIFLDSEEEAARQREWMRSISRQH